MADAGAKSAMTSDRTYAEQVADWLVDEGYTHCFFVAGGNIMHILNAVRTRFTCVPVVHEVAAGIAAEYFTATTSDPRRRAFALVTAGPGLTNILTALGGAYLESRELLVIGGQVKSSDLSGPGMRQRGIQEIDGMALARPVCVETLQIRHPVERHDFDRVVRSGAAPRKGPVFIEFCLDAQAAPAIPASSSAVVGEPGPHVPSGLIAEVHDRLLSADRPVLLVGGGISRRSFAEISQSLHQLGVPIATTWNALDRIDSADPLYFGRPDTWGMRWANVLIQQADLVIAVGARLGIQQTGFNWQAFAPLADIVHVDLDASETRKGHPTTWLAAECDGPTFLADLAAAVDLDDRAADARRRWDRWREFGSTVRDRLPLDDPGNLTQAGYTSPYSFVDQLSNVLTPEDVVVPCSSGGASTVMMQSFRQKLGQVVINNRALASMGYGLSGAIGASLAWPGRRTVLVEGDGGFVQNLQELGTVAAQNLNLKIFIFANEGYASIRMTQRNYFGGAYVGCDTTTGLGLPDWAALFAAYGLPSRVLDPHRLFDSETIGLLDASGPVGFIVPIDPEQTYYPKISSRVTSRGGMESNPLHLMDPQLDESLARAVMPYLLGEANDEQD